MAVFKYIKKEIMIISIILLSVSVIFIAHYFTDIYEGKSVVATSSKIVERIPNNVMNGTENKAISKQNENEDENNAISGKKKIAITFDDGPSGVYTENLLDELKARDVRATFFLVGENIKGNENIVMRMAKEGHLIGNHTFSHVDLAKLKFNEACDEIQKTNAYIYNISGYMPQYIRPPYGSCGDRILQETNMTVILWNIDPLDWRDQNTGLVTSRIIKNAEDGDIILLHDIFKTSVNAAIKVIDALKKKGFTFVTVDEISSDNTAVITHDSKTR